MDISKGGGSAWGGKWQPKKDADKRLTGDTGDVNRTTDRNGNEVETKIGDDGLATGERHNTSAPNPDSHSNPHDHDITWEDGYPNFGPPINYWDGNVPEFKSFIWRKNSMGKTIGTNTPEEDRFKTISDFKWCMRCGGEVVFIWKGKTHGIASKQQRTKDSPIQLLINQLQVSNIKETEKWCDTADEVLEYIVSGDRLRDVITQVTVTYRTI